jgi:imidazolonepropionase-like amidohydrolase
MRAPLALLAALALTGAAPLPQADPTILIRGARVFDGSGDPAIVEDVLIQGAHIAAVGRDLAAPAETRIIDARGLTLIPGLHDLHTHLRSPAFSAPDDLGKAYAGYLAEGVTTVNDYSVSGEMIAPIREMTGNGAVTAPHLELAVRLGVPGGHGTEQGWGNFFTLQVATPRAAHIAMKTALAYRPDLIKVFADGWRYDRDLNLNSMNEPTLAAIVEDAHKAGIPVITHTVTLEGAKIAAAAGVDSVGHGVGDALVDDELIGLMKAHHTAYIATLVVFEPQEDRTFVPAEWQALRPAERAIEQKRMSAPLEHIPAYESKRWAIMQENIRRLKAAGVPIGIGTDAGIGGVYHGPSTLREIGWLAKLSFTPAEALAAATSTSAAIIGQSADHGRIAPGMRADLVLTGGKPDQDIADLWDVRRVFVSGREQPLDTLRAMLNSDAPTPLPTHRMAGPIDTGAGPPGRTDLDTLPVESTEPGIDHSHLDYVRTDDVARAHQLFLVAHMGSAPRPFAQLILPLTRGAIQLADARGFTGIAFTVRGAGEYQMLFDGYGLRERARFRAPFAASDRPHNVNLPFAAFQSRDPTAKLNMDQFRALIVQLSGEPGGKAWLQLSNVRFYR